MWETDFGHSSVFRGYKGQSPLGGYRLSVGDKSLGRRWVASRRRGCCTVATLLAEHAQLHQLAKQLLIE